MRELKDMIVTVTLTDNDTRRVEIHGHDLHKVTRELSEAVHLRKIFWLERLWRKASLSSHVSIIGVSSSLVIPTKFVKCFEIIVKD